MDAAASRLAAARAGLASPKRRRSLWPLVGAALLAAVAALGCAAVMVLGI